YRQYSYDERDRLTSIEYFDSITGIASAFTYDADNRLKTATETNGEIIEYTQENKYNGFGQRVQKKRELMLPAISMTVHPSCILIRKE
ncbi:MAG: RHS repeat protein, partial [Firmicutes bacterium]|nr:RHS repeat protein [Bacillota bacterium]